jgi:hypothetical protein
LAGGREGRDFKAITETPQFHTGPMESGEEKEWASMILVPMLMPDQARV